MWWLPATGELSKAFRRVALSLSGADTKTRNELLRRILESISITKVERGLTEHASLNPRRTYRLGIRVATERLLAHGNSDLDSILRRQAYANLDFSLTIEIRSNAKEQSIFVLETNYSVVTTQFRPAPKSPVLLPAAEGNAVQKAYRWKAIIDAGNLTLGEVAKREEVSTGLVSQYVALLGLPQRMLSFFREGRDSELKKPFSFREMQRLLDLSPEQAEAYFSARIVGKPLQDELSLTDKAG